MDFWVLPRGKDLRVKLVQKEGELHFEECDAKPGDIIWYSESNEVIEASSIPRPFIYITYIR
jgi:hypothetical protein